MKFPKAFLKAITVFLIILTGNILTFTIFLLAAVGFIAGAIWLAFQTPDNPYLYIRIDLLLIAAFLLEMNIKTFRKALREMPDRF